MGLDMYLYARRYTSPYVDEDHYKKIAELQLAFPGNPESFEVKAQVAYWRKVNAVHGWFVRNVANGEDDCRPAYVAVEQLRELRELCTELLKKRDPKEAAEKLPVVDGFMFGGTGYDEWYWQGVEDTVEQLGAILVWDELRAHALGSHYSDVDYLYEASW
jgi:hypothetical protein